MSAVLFLLLAVGISVVGSFIMWAWANRPQGPNHSIDEFDKGLQALSKQGKKNKQSDADYFGL